MANAHEDVSEERKHTPKNFDDSANIGDTAWKNELEVHEYFPSGRFPSVISFAFQFITPPTTTDGDIYVLTDIPGHGIHPISTLTWQSGTTVRATFDAGFDNSLLGSPMYMHVEKATNTVHNGRFLTTAITSTYAEFSNVLVTDATDDEAASPSRSSFGHQNWEGATAGDWVRRTSGVWNFMKVPFGAIVNQDGDSDIRYNKSNHFRHNSRYWEYFATLIQSGTGSPSLTVINPSSFGSITWARTGVGTYTGTKSITGGNGYLLFDTNTIFSFDNSGNSGGSAKIVRTSATVVTITTYDSSGSLADSVMTDNHLTIKTIS